MSYYRIGKLLSRINDSGELACNERCAADKTAVNVRLCKKLCGILFVHRATVLDGRSLGNLLTVK